MRTLERILGHGVNMTPGLLAGALLWLALLPFRKRRLAARGFASGKARERGMLLLWMFSGGMAVITLAPEPSWLLTGLTRGYWSPYFDTGYLACRVSLIPFSQLDSLFNVAGNIVMFLPFGFFAALLWRGYTWKRALVTGFCITGFVECWQLLVGRCFDVDDIIFNALGALCGYLLWRLLNRFSPKLLKSFIYHINEETA